MIVDEDLPAKTGDDEKEKLDVLGSLPFLVINILGLGAFAAYVGSWFFFAVGVISLPLHWGYGLVIFARYVFQMFFVTGVRHRYFSHRTYKVKRWFQAIIAFIATADLQKGILWWAGHHRVHHDHSDTPDDPHTTKFRRTRWEGFKWAHLGWILSGKYNETPMEEVRDLAKFPELRFLDRPYGYLIAPILTAAGMYYLGRWVYGSSGGIWMLLLGFFTSTTFLYHGTFAINSLAHMFGTRTYSTNDESRNNWWLAIITLGEGWHNNHHHDRFCERQGRQWWQIDFSHYVIVAFSWLRLVSHIRRPGPRLPE